MHIKLDENADPRWRAPLEEAGHTVSTVTEEKLQGKTDATIAAICLSLDMCLLTLDLDFAQTAAYPPAEYPGIEAAHLGFIRYPALPLTNNKGSE